MIESNTNTTYYLLDYIRILMHRAPRRMHGIEVEVQEVGPAPGFPTRGVKVDRKGTNGVSINGVTADFTFFDRGTFWVLPLIYFYIPKSARACLFPQSVKIDYFCSGPISVDPICP